MTATTLAQPYAQPEHVVVRQPRWWSNWTALEWFVVVQYLSTALLFVPGAQSVRMIIRTLPYLLGGIMLFTVRGRTNTARPPAGTTAIALAMLTLTLNMLHPSTQALAGLAQLALQLCIAAPLLWVGRRVRSVAHFERLLLLVLACNAISAVVGLLQVYYPDVFLPTEFNRSALAGDEKLLTSLSYIGTEGRTIIRPPGLTDMPGGAAGPAMLVALFGMARAAKPRTPLWQRALLLLLVGIGFSLLYFTQVRSILLMTIVALGAFAVLAVRQRRPLAAIYTVGVGSVLLVGAFAYAVAVGGEAVANRFTGITNRGVVESYQTERGGFVSHTVRELLPKYPFGAGVGRWGVMNLYFADRKDPDRPALYAEIQMTGWLYDGGIFMWLFYGGGVLLSLRYAYRLARRRGTEVGYQAALVFCAQLMIAGMTMAGPAFNTQLGVQFWTLAAALHAADARQASEARRASLRAVRTVP